MFKPIRVTITEISGPNRKTYRHRARSLSDALEWFACYPKGTKAVARTRLGRVIAERVTP